MVQLGQLGSFKGGNAFLYSLTPALNQVASPVPIMKKICVLLMLLLVFTFKCYYSGVTKHESSSKIFISRRDVKNKLTKTFRVNTLGNVVTQESKYLSFLYKTPSTSEMIWDGFCIIMETAEEFNLSTIVKILDLYIKLSKIGFI